MEIIYQIKKIGLATVYLAKMPNGKHLEFVESQQPPHPKEKKWVLIISTLYGCPVGCPFCDANSTYQGRVSKVDLFKQIDYLLTQSFPTRTIPVEKFKIQFARMGEPAFNRAVIEVLSKFSTRYDAPGFIPSISTIAPKGCDDFFEDLLKIKREQYRDGRFQLQFSIHTTDLVKRDQLIPIKKWSFDKIAQYGEQFFEPDDRKITLNFALAENSPIDPNMLTQHFSPEKFLIKLTPINPTLNAKANNISSYIDPQNQQRNELLVQSLKSVGYDVILSIGELEENRVGSNCGQYVKKYLDKKELDKTYRAHLHAND